MVTIIQTADMNGFEQNKLFDVIKGLAIQAARTKFSALDISKQTDNSTGTASTTGAIAAVSDPALFKTDGVATTAAPKTGFDTATGKLANAAASVAYFINPYRAELGLTKITIPSGPTVTAAIPALDKTLSGVATTGALEAVSGKAQLTVARNNFATVLKAANEVMLALGYPALTDGSGGTPSSTYTLTASASTSAAVDGSTTNSLADSAVDTALTNLANNYATLSLYINRALDPDETTNLTDNSSGTASTALPPAIEALTLPTAYTTAGTDCAPKAGFDTQLTAIENNQADLTLKVNTLIDYLNENGRSITKLTNSTGVAGDATIEALSVNLTAVTGSTSCVDATTGIAACTVIRNNTASLVAKINEISAIYGYENFSGTGGGTASTTIANIAATGAGNDGSASQTLSDTAVDAFLAANRNNIATMAARLTALDNVGSSQALLVVAGQ